MSVEGVKNASISLSILQARDAVKAFVWSLGSGGPSLMVEAVARRSAHLTPLCQMLFPTSETEWVTAVTLGTECQESCLAVLRS